jgi:hypothetical protein
VRRQVGNRPSENESTVTLAEPTKIAGRAGRGLGRHVIRLEQALSTTGPHPVGSVDLPVADAERPGWWGRGVGATGGSFLWTGTLPVVPSPCLRWV